MNLENKILFETIFQENKNKIKRDFIDKFNIIDYNKLQSLAKTINGGKYKVFYNSGNGIVGFMTHADWLSDRATTDEDILFVCKEINQDIFNIFKRYLYDLIIKGV